MIIILVKISTDIDNHAFIDFYPSLSRKYCPMVWRQYWHDQTRINSDAVDISIKYRDFGTYYFQRTE